MSGGGARVSIPAGVRRTIQNIKEIAGNHSDEEIYAMLKECAMDPNETAQKLLLEDTFHEVKRKRDKRKENVREPADPRWRSGMQGRGSRGGRGNYASRSVPNDAAAGRNVTSGKENGVDQGVDKVNTFSSSTTPDTENKSAVSISSSVSVVANGPSNIDHPISSQGFYVSGVSGVALWEESSGVVTTKTGSSRSTPTDVKSGSASRESAPGSDECLSNKTAAPLSEVYASTSDPVLVPSLDTCNPAELGNINWVVETVTSEAASQDISESNLSYISGEGSSDMGSHMHGKIPIKSQGLRTNELSEKSQLAPSSSSLSGATSSRPSSTYGNRSQPSGLQKASVPNKEWKPKSIHASPAQASEMTETSDVPVVAEAVGQLLPAPCSVASEEATRLEKKLEELKLSDRKHVIIPNHLQVPESERHGLSFGSFDANFELNVVFAKVPVKDKTDTPLSESSQGIEETIEQPSLSIHTASSAAEEVVFPDQPQSPEQVPDNYSTKEAGVSSSISAAAEYDKSKQEAALAPEGLQNLVVQSAPAYPPLGLVPQALGTQLAQFESSEPQARDTSRLPSFLVQQSYDPSTSYYAPFYRSTADADGRISPFLAPGGSMYNGNIAVLPAQIGQASHESTNSIMLSTAGPTPLSNQAAGTMQGSVAIPQAPVPVFRQPAGLHISHYPPNYIPYSQYFSPFYVPPPTLHHFLSSAAFPQQPPTGSMFPTPGAAAPAAPVKYSLPQYKPGANTGNSTIVGMPTGYGMYNSTPAGYTPDPASTSGNSTANEDLGSSQFKENNVCVAGQQSEGSAVWIPAPGRDISTFQASSFYSIPPQGQHMPFAPTQAGHGGFSGIYHPTATVSASVHPLLQQSQTVAGAVEMVAPPAGVYQQPQRAQMNWTNNY